MAEKLDEWPRVHTCLYDWCPKQSDECKRCDAVVAVIHREAIIKYPDAPNTNG